MLPNDAEPVLTYWFGEQPDDPKTIQEKSKLWWSKSESVDRSIRDRFGALRERAKERELDDWLETARGRLALIVLLDQFSRNLYRGDAETYAADSLALAWALEGIERGEDRKVPFSMRTFFYLPLEHAEDVDLQRRSVRLFEEMVPEVPDALRDIFQGYVKYAVAHRDIVERFGRFPHRNAILGRESTQEEIEFLKEPGASF